MLKVDLALNGIPANPGEIVLLMESTNQPLVNIPQYGTAHTMAYVVGTRSRDNVYGIYVFLGQPETRASLVYVCQPRQLTGEQYSQEAAEAARFVESMGFAMNTIPFGSLAPHEAQGIIQRLAIFQVDGPTGMPVYDLVDVADDQGDAYDYYSNPPGQHSRTPTYSQVPQGRPPPPPGRDQLAGEAGLIFGGDAGVLDDLASSLPGQGQQGQEADRGLDPDSLSRLGRLLSSFCLLVALFAGTGCHQQVKKDEPLPGKLQTQVDLGTEHLKQGQAAEAIRVLEAVLEEAPYSRDALYVMGAAHLQLGRLDQAETYLRRAIEADPKWSMPKNMLATILMRVNRCAEAEKLLIEVTNDIFFDPPHFAQHNLARAEFCLGKKKEALERLERVLAQRPRFCLGYLTLAEYTWDQRQVHKTIEVCDRFRDSCETDENIKDLVTPENSCMCYLRKGLAYAELGHVDMARESFMSCRSGGTYGRECRKSLELLEQ